MIFLCLVTFGWVLFDLLVAGCFYDCVLGICVYEPYLLVDLLHFGSLVCIYLVVFVGLLLLSCFDLVTLIWFDCCIYVYFCLGV